jgi:hypothetical protein
MPARKLAETDTQIQTLHHHVPPQCVAITSSIDTLPPELILDEMRERWLVEVRQTVVALGLAIERFTDGPKVETPVMMITASGEGG